MMKSLTKLGMVLIVALLVGTSPGVALAQNAVGSPDAISFPGHGITVSTDRPVYFSDFMPSPEGGWRAPLIKMSLTVFNNTENPVTFNFNSSQRYDFIIYNSSGMEVWRWSDGYGFLMVLGELTLKPGEAITYTVTHKFAQKDGTPMPEGKYTLKGVLVASGKVLEGKVGFSHQYVY